MVQSTRHLVSPALDADGGHRCGSLGSLGYSRDITGSRNRCRPFFRVIAQDISPCAPGLFRRSCRLYVPELGLPVVARARYRQTSLVACVGTRLWAHACHQAQCLAASARIFLAWSVRQKRHVHSKRLAQTPQASGACRVTAHSWSARAFCIVALAMVRNSGASDLLGAISPQARILQHGVSRLHVLEATDAEVLCTGDDPGHSAADDADPVFDWGFLRHAGHHLQPDGPTQ